MWIALMKLTLGKKLLAVKLNGNSTATTDNNNKDESNGKIKSGKEKNLYAEKKNSTLEINSSDSNINLGKQGHSNFSSSPDTLNSAPSTFSRSKGPSRNSGTDSDSKSEEQVDSEKK
jgi:hypothetical protein